MMRQVFVISALMLTPFALAAQQSITPQVMAELQKSYENTVTDKALRNAVSANSLSALVLNRDNTAVHDTYFSVEVPYTGISDQKSSGRCWLFTGTNVLRAKAMEKYNVKNFFFSQITAMPNPRAVLTVFETARYEHIPRKKANIILSTKIERTNKLIKLLSIFL